MCMIPYIDYTECSLYIGIYLYFDPIRDQNRLPYASSLTAIRSATCGLCSRQIQARLCSRVREIRKQLPDKCRAPMILILMIRIYSANIYQG